MLERNKRFLNEKNPAVLARLLRSLQIAVLRRAEDRFEALNKINGHKYNISVTDGTIVCTCPNSQRGHACKHEMAVSRDMPLFEK